MPIVSKVLIVGGGIAGLASATALAQIGIHCDIAEIGSFEPVGAGIGLAGRAPFALEELGVYEEVAAKGQVGLGAPAMHDLAGDPLGPPPPPPNLPPGSREPVGAFRPVLAETLANRAREMGATLETNLSVEAIEDGPDGATVTMTNGEVRDYDLVIGADGVSSKVRSLVFPDAPKPEYVGQMSIRWVFEHNPVEGEGWYVAGEMGRMAFYHQPWPNVIYAPMVINMPRKHLSQEEIYEIVGELLDKFTAPAIVELRKNLTPDSTFIARPFDWLLVDDPWYRGRVLLIGDAAHATTAHMGMGGVMALEDGVVLGQCLKDATTLEEALSTFMTRRFERAGTVVKTSAALSKLEQDNRPPGPQSGQLMGAAMAVLFQPY